MAICDYVQNEIKALRDLYFSMQHVALSEARMGKLLDQFKDQFLLNAHYHTSMAVDVDIFFANWNYYKGLLDLE